MALFRSFRRTCTVVAAAGSLCAAGISPANAGADNAPLPLHHTTCVYPSDHISILDTFDRQEGTSISCVMLFNDAAPNWVGWAAPWFDTHTYTDMQWSRWATEPGTHHRLIITQNLFPASEDDNRSVLTQGAAGEFTSDARALARHLVAVGLGDSVIRLAHEANGTWYPDSLPDTPRGDRLWVRFWRQTVFAMRSVRGAHFLFDWCVNAGVRPIPLKDFYPGNDAVNIVGVDAYDAGVAAGPDRWSRLYNEPDGLGAVLAFARAHHKPLSIPEWGLGPAALDQGGDDAAYVRGIASVVAHGDVAFQSYFDADSEMLQLANSPQAERAYARAFGDRTRPRAAHARLPRLPRGIAPFLHITGGPRYAATVSASSVTFNFDAQAGMSVTCSLDNSPWRACSSPHGDVVTGLAKGFHQWAVRLEDAQQRVSLQGRVFDVR